MAKTKERSGLLKAIKEKAIVKYKGKNIIITIIKPISHMKQLRHKTME